MALNDRFMYAEQNGLGYGWRNVNGQLYFFHPQTFFAVNGAQKIDGNTFVFENYVLVKGVWIYRDYGKKLLWGNAYLTASWYTEDDKTYYLLPSGICAVGTVDISHVDENGNTVTETYVFDEEGVLIGKA
jgi:glucan-binding YG repeat protein